MTEEMEIDPQEATLSTSDIFAPPSQLQAKAAPELIDLDAGHFTALAAALRHMITRLSERLEQARSSPVRAGQEALERDQEIHRLAARLRLLSRYDIDLCLGRMISEDGTTCTYIGRIGVHDEAGTPLVIDWRSAAAEPFFAATAGHPMGLSSRRRYRWSRGRVVDYWDEAFTSPAGGPAVHLDQDSALLSSLGRARTERMHDVLATIAADQDAIIRADSRRPLLVEGGPGTGKTVVALHRAAYLLYNDSRLHRRGGSILFVGPHRPYLAYIADVLPDLGEEGVRTSTVSDLVPEGASAVAEQHPRIAALKSDVRMVAAIEPAVALYEEPPADTVELETPWGESRLDARDWADAFEAVAAGTPHNEAHEQIWEVLADILIPRLARDGRDEHQPSVDDVATELRRIPELADALNRAWPLLDAADVVADLWEVPAYLRRCAPWLSAEERALLRRPPTEPWTDADLPLLDAARHRLGDPHRARRERRRQAERAESARQMDAVVEHLVASDDSEMRVMSMLTTRDLREALAGADSPADSAASDLSGPFEHVVVDEAQELTDAQWSMILRRCPSRSLTIVGDRAQSRLGFPEGWDERLARIGLHRLTHARLTINYRTPAEIMAEAEPTILAVVPDATVPRSIRRTGIPVGHGVTGDLDTVLATWLAEHAEGTAAVISTTRHEVPERVQCLTPLNAKGLEFDLVVLVAPERFGADVAGAVDRYVAMTRATQQLVILTDDAGLLAR